MGANSQKAPLDRITHPWDEAYTFNIRRKFLKKKLKEKELLGIS